MADIRPFRALRPNKEFVDQVSAPLLDATSKVTSWALMEKNPLSYLHVVKPHLHFNGEKKNPAKHFPLGMEYLQRFMNEKILVQDTKPSYYIYQCIKGSRSYTGIIAAASVDEYNNNRIMKHENTLTEKQQEILEHISFFKNIGSPVLLTFPDSDLIDELIEQVIALKPEYSFISDDSLKHNLWVINDEETLKLITEDFARFNKLYIADGHHRTAGAAAYAEQHRKANPQFTGNEYYNFFPVCLVPFSKLHIYEYHRLIKDSRVYEPDFLPKVEQYFYTTPCGNLPFQPLKKTEFGLYFNNHAFQLKLKPEFKSGLSGVLENLDVSITEEFLLKRVFEIEDSKTDPRLSFIDGSKGIKNVQDIVSKHDVDIAITLFPTSVNEVIEVAEKNMIMPPKSTWVEPKMRTGLIIYTEQ